MIPVENLRSSHYFRPCMMKSWITILIAAWATVLPQSGAAQVTCEAIVEKNVIEVGQTFTLTVQVSGKNLDIPDKPAVPQVAGLELVYPEPGTSSSIQIINGRRSESRSFQYLLRATAVGRWTLPPIRVSVGGEHFQTQQLTIEVVPAGSISGQNPGDTSADVFFAAVPSKREAYIGEQVVVDFKIYTRVTISQYSPTRTPSFVGFWVEEFPLRQPLEGAREVVNGKSYTSYTIKRVGVFATRAGVLELDPAEIECELRLARRKSNDPFDNFFSPFSDPFGETVTKKLATQAVPITIRNLPAEGKPDNFSGLVGQFDVASSVDRTTLRTGDALSYKIDISGAGNLRAIEEPENPFPDEFEKYPVKTQEAINKNGNIIAGSKSFEFVVVPRVSKTWIIEPFTLTFFDPGQKKYVTTRTDSITLRISEGVSTGNGPRDVALLKQDLRFLRTDAQTWTSTHRSPWVDAGLGLLMLIPPALVGWRVARKRQLARLQSDGARYRSHQASPLARKRLKEIQKLLSEGDQERFYSELNRLLNQFIGDKLNLGGLQLIRDEIADRLRRRGVSISLVEDYLRCLQWCDEARFSPSSSVGQETDKVYQLVRTTILEIDRHL